MKTLVERIFSTGRTTYSDFDQDCADWHLKRMGKLTGSLAHKIATAKRGKALTQTAKTYMESLISDWMSPDIPPDELGGKAIRWGNDNEPIARDELLMIIGAIEENGFVELNEFMGCSDDGTGYKDRKKFLVEIKCPLVNHVKHILMALENEGNPKKQIPAEYYWQCVWNSIVCQCDFFYFVSFGPRVITENRLSIVKVHMKDIEADVQQLKEAAVYFCEELEKKLTTLKLLPEQQSLFKIQEV
jgi:hypothetical protein